MVYLDNAATSFPKPLPVVEEQARCMRTYCGNAGHGSHRLAMAAAEKLYECRGEAARFFGYDAPEQVIFTWNTTMALNMAIKGLVREGDHVLLSDIDHNATLRPIHRLAAEGKITFDLFPSYANDPHATAEQICNGIRARIRPHTRMLVCTHASNICSAVLPLEAIGALCREKKILFVVDAAQSAGTLPIDMEKQKIDALCVPGHKGLFGPQGIGILLLRKGLECKTFLEGGSGFHSLDRDMPKEPPERYEAGTLPIPAIAGLCEGIRSVERLGIDAIAAHERNLNCLLQERLMQIPGVKVYAPHHVGSVLLFQIKGISSDAVGTALDQQGFCVRTGYHCAPLAHAVLGTPRGGAVRVSPGIFNTREEIERLSSAILQIRRYGV